MDPIITNTLLGSIIMAVGWMGRTLWESIKAYKTGHKADLQRRDEIIADLEARLTALRRRKKDLRGEYDFLRAWLLAQEVLSSDQLEKLPKPPPRDHD